MTPAALALRPGVLVVLEGLDKTGKTTQREELRSMLDPESVVFAHMPSGFVPFTTRVYDALEADSEGPTSGLAQQLAHLACHAESINHLVKAVGSKALVLDRWWWSTLAYGWFGGPVKESGLSERSFQDLIDTIWRPVTASVIFVFLEPHQPDGNENDGVAVGYRALVRQCGNVAVPVPSDTPERTHEFIVTTLLDRGLAVRI